MDVIEKGDKVLCISAEEWDDIEEGETYTVLKNNHNLITLKGTERCYYKDRFEPVQENYMNLDKDKIRYVLANAIRGSRLSPKNKPEKGQKISVNGNTVYVVERVETNFVDLFFNCFGTWHKKCVKLDAITSSIADQIDDTCTINSKLIDNINFFEDKVEVNFIDGSTAIVRR